MRVRIMKPQRDEVHASDHRKIHLMEEARITLEIVKRPIGSHANVEIIDAIELKMFNKPLHIGIDAGVMKGDECFSIYQIADKGLNMTGSRVDGGADVPAMDEILQKDRSIGNVLQAFAGVLAVEHNYALAAIQI